MPKNPEDVKEWCIQFTRELGGSPIFPSDLRPRDISNVTMLDPNLMTSMEHVEHMPTKLDANIVESMGIEGPAYTSSDLHKTLDSMAENEKDFQFARNVAGWLSRPEFTKLKESAEMLMDEEIASFKTSQIARGLHNKAKLIAKYRGQPSLPNSAKIFNDRKRDKPDKFYEFKVFLRVLIAGHGSNQATTTLTFPYNVGFYEFLDTIRHETELCMIPPLALTFEDRNLAFQSMRDGDTSVEEFSEVQVSEASPDESTNIKNESEKSQQPTSNDTRSSKRDIFEIDSKHGVQSNSPDFNTVMRCGSPLRESTTSEMSCSDSNQEANSARETSTWRTSLFDLATQSAAPQTLSSQIAAAQFPTKLYKQQEPGIANGDLMQKGYTLAHGPWVYRFMRLDKGTEQPAGRTENTELSNEEDFEYMKCHLMTENRKAFSVARTSLFLCHSLDFYAMRQWKDEMDKYKDEDQKWIEDMRELHNMDPEEDAYEFGEPWLYYNYKKSVKAATKHSREMK
ncbi:hypothetical protein BGZ60DRAFT_179635 [Tricladium varicosporioides]|nr:hypothetical protein BGZ60DRAFT_179635 [Hymenoscyphus varicosporioides]